MTLEGANNFSENNNSTIYTMNSVQTGQYCVVIPKNLGNSINMLVDLNMKNLFDSLINNTISKDILVKEIGEEYDNILGKYASGVLVLPMLDMNELNGAINGNDKQKMLEETKKIGSITSEIYKKLSDAGVDKSKIDQKIIIVEKTDVDNKFVLWLEEQMPNFVEGVSYDELKNNHSNNNLGNVNPFTGEANEPVVEPVNDIFGGSDNSAVVSNPEPVIIPEESSTEVEENSTDSSTEQSQTEPVVEPQPVTDTKLETTQTIPNTLDSSNNVSLEPISDNNGEEVNELDKKSGGFANLLILAVILVVVTVASIELGKILYNTFGA